MADRPLNPRQQRFVQEYLRDLNATQAAIRAGYSEKTASSIGQENLTKPEIAAAIGAATKARSERTEVDQDWVVRRLRQESEFAGEGASHSARVNALKLLGQHVGMFKDREKPPLESVLDILRTVLGADDFRRVGEHLRQKGSGGGDRGG